MAQKQRVVSVVILGEKEGKATATGNNASWNCPCGYELPLLGRSGVTEGEQVHCPACNRCYKVIPDGKPFSRVLRVDEIS